MSIGRADNLHTDKEREGSSVCQNCIQIITVVHVIIFNIHLSHSQNGGYFCTQYKFVSKGLQGFTVGWTHDS